MTASSICYLRRSSLLWGQEDVQHCSTIMKTGITWSLPTREIFSLPDVKALYNWTHGGVRCPFCKLSEWGTQAGSGIMISGTTGEGGTQKQSRGQLFTKGYFSLGSLISSKSALSTKREGILQQVIQSKKARYLLQISPWKSHFSPPWLQTGHRGTFCCSHPPDPVLVCPGKCRSRWNGSPRAEQHRVGTCHAGRRTKGRGWPVTKRLQNGHQ